MLVGEGQSASLKPFPNQSTDNCGDESRRAGMTNKQNSRSPVRAAFLTEVLRIRKSMTIWLSDIEPLLLLGVACPPSDIVPIFVDF